MENSDFPFRQSEDETQVQYLGACPEEPLFLSMPKYSTTVDYFGIFISKLFLDTFPCKNSHCLQLLQAYPWQ